MTQIGPGELLLNRYRLASLLGRGASAEVWLATDERLGRPVALKLLHGHLLPDAGSRERFVAEARAVAALHHPGIVGIYDVVADASMAAIVFEYVPGESLESRLARSPDLGAEAAARIAAEIAEALAAAHRAGIVHRDVKPGNVLLMSPGGSARLVDFGIARILEPAAARLTRAGEIVGTLATMAPEQLAGEAVGPATDVYSLGVVLYQMLAGRPPFDAATPMALAELQREPPRSIPAAPGVLTTLVFRMLRFDPADRPSSAAEVAAYLRGWLEGRLGEPWRAAPVAPVPGPAAASWRSGLPDSPTVVVPAVSGRSRPSRRRVLGTGAAIIAVAAIPVLVLTAESLLSGTVAPSPSPSASGSPGVTPAAIALPSSPPASPSPSPTVSDSPVPSDSPIPTVPPVSVAPIPTQLSIVTPTNGTITDQRRIIVSGFAPPGMPVTRDVPFGPDDHTVADDLGDWQIPVTLDPGMNVLAFRLGNDRSTQITVQIYYHP